MNYNQTYNDLIEKSRSNTPMGYSEVHHIIPRCMGGGNDKDNLVRMSARAHFVAHLLLAKMYGGKLIIAAFRMSCDGKHASRTYEWLRRKNSAEVSKNMKGNTYGRFLKGKMPPERAECMRTPEARAKLSLALRGNKNWMKRRWKATSESARKSYQTRIRKGNHLHLPETKAKAAANHASMSGAHNPMYGRKQSAEAKAKMRAARLKAVSRFIRNDKGVIVGYKPIVNMDPNGSSNAIITQGIRAT